LVQHGSNVKALTFNSANKYQPPKEVQLPFQQLRSLTKLWATDADLLNLTYTAYTAGATGSSSRTITSSSGSGNPLSALTSLAELGLSCGHVFGARGALQYLPALGASLTRLRLEHVSFR
jgi:hypothetical protein